MPRVEEAFMYTITGSQGAGDSGIRDYLVLSTTDLLTVYIFLPERFESA